MGEFRPDDFGVASVLVLIDETWLDNFSPNLPIFMAALEKPLLIFLRSSLALGLLGLTFPELSLEESSLANPTVLGVAAGVGMGVDAGVGATLLCETGVVASDVANLTDRGVVEELDFSSSLDFLVRRITSFFILICRTIFVLLVGGVCGSPLTLDPSNANAFFSFDFVPDARRGVVGALTEPELPDVAC